jgi:dihydrofolate reductase
MRKVVAAEYVTLDGVMTDPGGVGEIEHGGWSNSYFDDELAKHQSDQLVASDALLLGRKTFEGFAAAWPSMDASDTVRRFVAQSTLMSAITPPTTTTYTTNPTRVTA